MPTRQCVIPLGQQLAHENGQSFGRFGYFSAPALPDGILTGYYNPGITLASTREGRSGNVGLYDISKSGGIFAFACSGQMCRNAGTTSQGALNLIRRNSVYIFDAANRHSVDAQHIARIIYQEKMHVFGAGLKNVFFAYPRIYFGVNNASIGLAEMTINTAAQLLNIDTVDMGKSTRSNLVGYLRNDEFAIHLIAGNIASFERALGRPVTLEEATIGHNAGIGLLIRNISDLSQISDRDIFERSWFHQQAIADALR